MEPGRHDPANAVVADGQLRITMRATPAADLGPGVPAFTSASVMSLARLRYGFLEARCRAMPCHGSSAFWLFRNTPEAWTELDIFEICARGDHRHKVYTNAIHFHSPLLATHLDTNQSFDPQLDLSADFHVYGLAWDAEKMEYYFDGQLIRTSPNTYWKYPLHVLFDSNTFPGWFGLPEAKDLPATFAIDWIKTWTGRPKAAELPKE
jgi:beta-glucanase (GH16 family)